MNAGVGQNKAGRSSLGSCLCFFVTEIPLRIRPFHVYDIIRIIGHDIDVKRHHTYVQTSICMYPAIFISTESRLL